MKENNSADVIFYDSKPISIELPQTVELKVTDTEPSVKGATAAAQYKPATLETGIKITGAAVHRHRRGRADRHPHRRVHVAGEVKRIDFEKMSRVA